MKPIRSGYHAGIYAPGKTTVAPGYDWCEMAEGESQERRWRGANIVSYYVIFFTNNKLKDNRRPKKLQNLHNAKT
jgi:hypothetical protein